MTTNLSFLFLIAESGSYRDLGISNPALDIEEDHLDSATIRMEDQSKTTPNTSRSSAEPKEPTSPDSEYDEELAFPDSVTILSMGGENPILVQRKDGETDSIAVESEIPFLSVYNTPVKFTAFNRKIYIPGVEIQVEIIDHERNMTTHFLNPNL